MHTLQYGNISLVCGLRGAHMLAPPFHLLEALPHWLLIEVKLAENQSIAFTLSISSPYWCAPAASTL